MEWDHFEQIYLASMSVETGHLSISSRIAFDAIYIKEAENLSDEGCVTAICKNLYMQYFLGLQAFQHK